MNTYCRYFVYIIILTFALFQNVVGDDQEQVAMAYSLNEAIQAEDYKFIANLMHERSLGDFRKIVSSRLNVLQEIFSAEIVERILGISIADLEILSDIEYFEAACRSAASIEPLINPDPSEFSVLGIVVEDPDFYHVLYRHSTRIDSGTKKLEAQRVEVWTFRGGSGAESRLWTHLFMTRIPRIWYNASWDHVVRKTRSPSITD